MDILNLIVGLFMIGIGFLVKSSPNMIAGYNTMSKDKKKNVDIEGLSTFTRNGFIAIGLTIIIGYYLFKWIGLTMIANSMILIVTLIGVIILVINAQRFDHNKNKKTKLTYFILGLVILFVIGLITYGFIPSKTFYNDETIRFSGMYGFETKITEIENVELTDKLPKINLRTNGFSFGSIKKGTFSLDKFGKARLLIHSDLPPYLIISKKNDEKIIINFKDKTETEKIYTRIKTLINN
jgi:Co/Zn/Cd efflux system component